MGLKPGSGKCSQNLQENTQEKHSKIFSKSTGKRSGKSQQSIQEKRRKSSLTPYGTIYDNGLEYSVSRLFSIWGQARGFIFTEKLEDGEDISELPNYGWTIIAGGGFAGFPTRQIRGRFDRFLLTDASPCHQVDRQ